MRFGQSIWGGDMYRASAFLSAIALAIAGSAIAAPVVPFPPDHVLQAVENLSHTDHGPLILVQNRARGGGRTAGGGGRAAQRSAGGGAQRSAAAANRTGSFNSNNFHQSVSNSRNASTTTNRTANVNATRNVNVSGEGGCCHGSYDDGPSWGGVAAGVAVGAVVGAAANAAASSTTYAAPPPTYPPGYVTPPPY